MQNLDANRAKRILITQVVATIIVTLIGALFAFTDARDALIGGVAASGGSALFAYWVFGRYSAQQPGQLVSQFYSGELIKIVFIVFVFGLAMKGLEDLNPVALFAAFFVVQVLPPMLANKIAR